jgi:hypothetical protein
LGEKSVNEFKKLAQEIRDEQLKKEIDRKHKLPLLDFSLLVLIILLAIVMGNLFVKLIV